MSSIEHKIYTGWVKTIEDVNCHDTFTLQESASTSTLDPLSDKIMNDIGIYGRKLSVQYFASDIQMDSDALVTAWLDQIEGIGSADYAVRWSDVTGYLWTDDYIMVGGHDLIEELQSHEGMYIHLEIKYSKE